MVRETSKEHLKPSLNSGTSRALMCLKISQLVAGLPLRLRTLGKIETNDTFQTCNGSPTELCDVNVISFCFTYMRCKCPGQSEPPGRLRCKEGMIDYLRWKSESAILLCRQKLRHQVWVDLGRWGKR